MPIIAIENPWTLPIEEVLYVALTITDGPKPVGIATRSQRHYGVRTAGPIKYMGYKLVEVMPPEIPEGTEVRWDGWLCFDGSAKVPAIESLVTAMEKTLGKAREIYTSPDATPFQLIRVSQSCSGGGYSPKLKFPAASDEAALMDLHLYPNPSRLPLPDLVSNIGKVEGLMGITNKSGGLMRCTDHGLNYSPDARLGFDLKSLTADLEAWGFYVLETDFGLMKDLPPISETRRCVIEEIGVTLPLGLEHYDNIC